MKWLLSLILFLILCGNIGYTQENTPKPNDAPNASTSEKPNVPTVTSGKHQNQEVQSKNVRAVPENFSVEKRMAKIAQEANDLALFQVIIGTIGLILVFFATLFAWGAWQAGKMAVIVTKDMGVVQTRAYIVIKSAEIYVPKSGWIVNPEGNHHFWTRAALENVGNTPAFKVEYKTKILINVPKPLDAKIDTPFSGYGSEFGSIPNNSTAEISGSIITHDIKSIGTTIPLETGITIIVWCEYEDVFENKYFTEATFEQTTFVKKESWYGLYQHFRLGKNGKIDNSA